MTRTLHLCPQCRSTRTKPKEGWPCAKCVRAAKITATHYVQGFVRSLFGHGTSFGVRKV